MWMQQEDGSVYMGLNDAGQVRVKAPGGMYVEGDVSITGGSLTHNGVNVGSTHTHGGVQTGSGRTQGPG